MEVVIEPNCIKMPLQQFNGASVIIEKRFALHASPTDQFCDTSKFKFGCHPDSPCRGQEYRHWSRACQPNSMAVVTKD